LRVRLAILRRFVSRTGLDAAAPRQPGWDGNGKHRQSELRAAELTDRGSGEPGLSAANGVTH